MANKVRKFSFLFMLVGGLLTGFAVTFPDTVGFIEWVSMIPMAVALMILCDSDRIKGRRAYLFGLLYFMSFYLVAFHWFLAMYPMEFTGMSRASALVVVMVAWIGLSGFQAVGSAFLFPIFAKLSKTEAVKRFPIFKPLLAASLFAIFEWLQTFGWWGVPWGRLPIGQAYDSVMIQSASLFGSYFLTFCIVAVNFLLAYGFIYGKKKKLAAILCASVFCFNLVSGIIISASYKETGKKVTAAAIQGNISSGDKWNSDKLTQTLDVYEKYTIEAAEKGAELVVWPETAIPYNITENSELRSYVSRLANETKVTIMVSAFTVKDGKDGLYNSIIEVRPDGSISDTVYSKRRLVPFGEFVPMRELVTVLIPPLAEIGMLKKDILPGYGSEIMDTAVGMVGCEICFDSIYEQITLEAVRDGAQVITVSTNDSWFEDSAAARMHNYQSALRAVESGRYIVRSANTGISSVIDPKGEIVRELGTLEEGYVICDVYMRDSATLYSVVGNIFVYFCIVFVVIPIIAEFVISRKHRKDE